MRDSIKTMTQLDATLAKIGYKDIQHSIPAGVRPKEYRKMLDSHGIKEDSFLGILDIVEQEAEHMAKTAEILDTPVVRFTGMPYDY
jgi:hypothetical protein